MALEKVIDGAIKEIGASAIKVLVGLLGIALAIALFVVFYGEKDKDTPPHDHPIPPQTIPLSPYEIAKVAVDEMMGRYPQRTITPQELDRIIQKVVEGIKTLQVEEQQKEALKLAAEAVEQAKHDDCVSMVNHMDVEGLPNMNDAVKHCMEAG